MPGRPDLDRSLASWTEEKKSLRDEEKVRRLNERLAMEWAIETGIIERLYTVDRGITLNLIELGLEALTQFGSNGKIERSAVMHLDHVQSGLRPEIEAAWLHHRFTQIHPFQDGNGRVARALATLIFMQSGFLPLVIRNAQHKDSYISALEKADDGDLPPLINLFSNIQSADLEAAITFVREIRGENVADIAAAAAGAFKRVQQEREELLAGATGVLVKKCEDRLHEVAYELVSAFEREGIKLQTDVKASGADNDSWWHHQVVSAAKHYGYFADLGCPRRWVQLRLAADVSLGSRWHMVFSFHHKQVRSGLIAVVAFLTTTEPALEDARPLEFGSTSEFSFSSSALESQSAFTQWLDGCVSELLRKWQALL